MTMRSVHPLLIASITVACAQIPSGDLQPGERPGLKTTEAGLWMQMDKIEDELKGSGRIVEDPELNAYLRDIVCRLEPAHCPDVRIHVVDVPHFNATIAPNGMMQVWTGLLLRTENEAQLAFVLGHELSHYVRRHSLQRWIDLKNKANAASIFSTLTSAAGVGFIGHIGEIAAIAGALSFSRDQEREADRIGTARAREARYDPREAPRIWQALKAERAASEKPEGWIFLSTHPGIDERVRYLEAAAVKPTTDGNQWIVGRDRLNAVLAGHLDDWLGDELTRGEFAESEVLFRRLLETDRRRGLVQFHLGELYRKRGEDGDTERAIEAYESALREPDVPPRAHRSLGQSLIRGGRDVEARVALEQYLAAVPGAPDRQIVEYQIQRLR